MLRQFAHFIAIAATLLALLDHVAAVRENRAQMKERRSQNVGAPFKSNLEPRKKEHYRFLNKESESV